MKFNPNKDVLYEIIGYLSEAELPLIFKGANVTNTILKENGSPYTRRTLDIDSTWYGSNPNTESIKTNLSEVLEKHDYTVEKIRDLEGKKISAGFKISKNGLPITKIDVDIHKISGTYSYCYGNVTFKGVTPEEIVADKLCAISSPYLYRRLKDIMDVYSLTQATNIDISAIYEIIKNSDHNLDDFNEFKTNKSKIEINYSCMTVENKPPFDEAYNCILNYINKLEKISLNK